MSSQLVPEEVEELVGHGELADELLPSSGRLVLDAGETGAGSGSRITPGRCRAECLDVVHHGLHLVEGEPEGFHPTDHEDLVDVVLGVEAEATVGASGWAKQPDLLPVTQAAQRELGAGGDLPDVHGRRGVGAHSGLSHFGRIGTLTQRQGRLDADFAGAPARAPIVRRDQFH